MKVSFCVIAKNEAAYLEACLSPLRDLVQEIIVIDTGSTDATREIAQRCGARVFEFPWCDDFSAARNQWVLHATGDWILWLDADDRVLSAEREKLRELFSSLEDSKNAYMLSCVCLTIDGGVGCAVEQVRLYPNRPEHRWRYRVHEQIAPALFETGTTLQTVDIQIVHTGYVDAAMLERKCERNFRLVEMDCVEGATNPLPLYNRAVMLLETERFDEAIVALHLCLPFIPESSLAAPRARAQLGAGYRAQGRTTEALDEVRAGRALYPTNRDLASIEAQLLVELGDLPGALATLLAFVPGHRDLTILDVRMRTLFGELSLRLGSPESAYEAATEVTRSRPSYGPAWLLLADAALELEKAGELAAIDDRLARCGGAEITRLLVRAAARTDGLDLLADARYQAEPFVRRVRARLLAGETRPLLSCLSPPWTTERAKVENTPRVFWQAANA